MTGAVALRVDTRVKAASYLALSCLYLQSYVPEPATIRREDVKPYCPGHWGCVPGILFALESISEWAERHHAEPQVIVGTGHAGAAWVGHGLLDGRFGTPDRHVLDRVIAGFGTTMPHENTAELPGMLWTGGELGHAVGIGEGMELADGRRRFVLIGDGELETGHTLGALWGRPSRASPVVIVNANGLRMGGPSRLSRMGRPDISAWLSAQGWTAQHVDELDSEQFQHGLDVAANQPTVVLYHNTKGGWPKPPGTAGDDPRSVHKLPLTQIATDAELDWLRDWFAQYHAPELLDESGVQPDEPHRSLAGHLNPALPGYVPPSAAAETRPLLEEPTTLAAFLNAATSVCPELLVTCPDEARSNRIDGLVQPPAELIELLNEPVVAAWAAGAALAGRPSAMVSYEGFAEVATSLYLQLDRHLELLGDQAGKTAPTVLVLTSTAWQNVYTHQDPGAVTGLLARPLARSRVVIPHRPAAATQAGLDAFSHAGRLTVAVVEKRPVHHPATDLKPLGEPGEPYVAYRPDRPSMATLVAVGEPVFSQAIAAAKLLYDNDVPTQVVAVNEPKLLVAPSPELDRMTGIDSQAVLVASTIMLPGASRGFSAPGTERFLRPVARAANDIEHLKTCRLTAPQLADDLLATIARVQSASGKGTRPKTGTT